MPRTSFEKTEWGDLGSKNYGGSGGSTAKGPSEEYLAEVDYGPGGSMGGPESFTDSVPNTYLAARIESYTSTARIEINRFSKDEPRLIAGAVVIYDGALIFGNSVSVGWR